MSSLLSKFLKRNTAQIEQQLEYSSNWINACIAFRDQLYNPRSVLYPSCGFDASPSRAFKNITFIDAEKGNEGCIDALRKAGLKAIKQDIRHYVPEENHDLLILMNPAIETNWATNHLEVGGYILSNDYHSNASWMAKNPDQFSLVGSLNEGKNPVVSRDLTGLFRPFENLEELKRTDPGRYDLLKKMISHQIKLGGKFREDKSLEENYFIYCDLLGMDRTLPNKRKAELYIFRKK